jgi:ribA/ribD-fused uncharacterized protein
MTPLEYVKDHVVSDYFGTLLFWHGPLSQWWYSPFVIDGEEYNCAEQYMMAQKARMFGDVETAAEIMITKGPHTDQKDFNQYPRAHQKLGRQVRGFDPVTWNAVARDTVMRANLAKFSQNDDLLAALAWTDPYTLVEASPYDKIWGIGMSDKNGYATDPDKWKGKNWLGHTLTHVRRYLIL